MIDCGIGNVDATSTHKKTQVNTAFGSRISLRRTEKPFSREGMHFSQFRIRSILVMGKWFCHELRHFVNKCFFICKQIKIKELHFWITTIWTHFLLSWFYLEGKNWYAKNVWPQEMWKNCLFNRSMFVQMHLISFGNEFRILKWCNEETFHLRFSTVKTNWPQIVSCFCR